MSRKFSIGDRVIPVYAHPRGVIKNGETYTVKSISQDYCPHLGADNFFIQVRGGGWFNSYMECKFRLAEAHAD